MYKTLRISLFIVSLSCCALCAWQMFVLNEAKQLWGYWTLGLLLSGWLTWISAALPIYVRDGNLRHLMLSTLSGLLLIAGFPNSPLPLPMFVGFVPLLLILADEHISKRFAMRHLYHALVLWNIGSTWWVGNAGLIPGVIANFLNAFFMCLPFLGYLILKRRYPHQLWNGITWICLWICWEWLHLNWELSWPWLTLGNAFAIRYNWVQWYEYTGVFGGSLWILAINYFIFTYVKKHGSPQKWSVRTIATIALMICLPIVVSYGIRAMWVDNPIGKSKVSVIQPNFEPHYEKFELSDATQYARFESLMLKSIDNTTDYVVFPETSFGLYDVERLNSYPVIQELDSILKKKPNLHLISGLDIFKRYVPSENLPQTVRKTRSGLLEIYNGAVQMTDGQSEIPYYKKGKMVPGAEAFPFRWLFGFLEPLFHRFQGTVEGLGTQAERSVFTSKNNRVKVGPLICYESIYGDYCRDYVHKGANILFIMTNDGWWDDTPGYIQHLHFASLRAIELRRAIARSANTGSSAFIDAYGDIHQATTYNAATAINADVSLYADTTFYTRFGDYLAWIILFMGIISVPLAKRYMVF